MTTENVQFLELKDGTHLAYQSLTGASPGVIFLSGFMSDMTGTKALALEAHCRETQRGFIRFDYYGHGQSSGEFREGNISRWRDDAVAVIDHLTEGPQILVGSSMGGWIMLLAALLRPERVAGLIGLAPAPDFTETLLWDNYDAETRAQLKHKGFLRAPCDYGEEDYLITWDLIEDGRKNLLLSAAIPLACPVRLLHGMADTDVPYGTSLRLAEKLEATDVEITLLKDKGHRLSSPGELALLTSALEAMPDNPSR